MSATLRLKGFRGGARLAVCAAGLMAGCLVAFPPAPHHSVFGTVKDEQGNPLRVSNAEIVLESGGRVIARSNVGPGLEPGVNYTLTIPLDSGVTADLYKPNALRPYVMFRMQVKVGALVYLPMEMSGTSGLATKPGERTRLNLTLGVDTDGDGLPDAWERALASMTAGNRTLEQIRPGDDDDGDGITNLQEYLAGTYAFDPEDGFELSILGAEQGASVMEFMSIRGRTYTLESSPDMRTWEVVPFQLATEAPSAAARQQYQAPDTRVLRVRATPPSTSADPAAPRFFKVRVH